jgi:threonine synthase
MQPQHTTAPPQATDPQQSSNARTSDGDCLSIADVERTANPLLESDGQQAPLSSICTYPDLRLLLILLLLTLAFTIAEMLGAVMANSVSIAAGSGTMVVGKYQG